MTDSQFMEAMLREGPATTMEIIHASERERECGLTPHSRAADLRKRLIPLGETVDCTARSRPGKRQKKVEWVYAIVPLAGEPA